MTKKFWNDWQKRFGETEYIYMKYEKDENNWFYPLFYPRCTKIIKGKFDGEMLTVILETTTPVYSINGIHYHKQIEVKNIKRQDIKTVYFYKLDKNIN